MLGRRDGMRCGRLVCSQAPRESDVYAEIKFFSHVCCGVARSTPIGTSRGSCWFRRISRRASAPYLKPTTRPCSSEPRLGAKFFPRLLIINFYRLSRYFTPCHVGFLQLSHPCHFALSNLVLPDKAALDRY